MKRLLLIAGLLLVPMVAPAQEPAPKPEPAATAPAADAPKPDSSLDTNNDGKVDADEVKAATDADAEISDVIKDATGVYEAVKDKKSLPKGTFWAVMLGAVFKLLLSLVKVLGKNVAWFKTKDGKRVVKYSTIGLGAAAALTANLAFGMHWMDAVQILLSGPLAVAIHEYTKDSKDSSDPDLGKNGPATPA